MKWMRNSAAAIGLSFGCYVIIMYLRHVGRWNDSVRMEEVVVIVAGPVSLVLASVVGWKYARTAGWWLIAEALLVGGWIISRAPDLATVYVIAGILTLPMFLCAALWLSYARQRRVHD